jgi:hypothetical protein
MLLSTISGNYTESMSLIIKKLFFRHCGTTQAVMDYLELLGAPLLIAENSIFGSQEAIA